MLDGLTDDQREAVTHGSGPLLVLAGAGSGKTGVLSRRLAWLAGAGIAPGDVVALAYNREAADTLRLRAEELIGRTHESLRVSTFHSFAIDIGRELGFESDTISSEDRRVLLMRRMNELELLTTDLRPGPGAVATRFVSRIDRCRDELVEADRYLEFAEAAVASAAGATQRRDALEQLEFARAFVAHDRWLAEMDRQDYGLLLTRVLERLDADPGARERVCARIRHLIVDEFQDTNYALTRLLFTIGDAAESIVVVGDDDQGIYRFRGASDKNFADFRERYRSAAEITLDRNFRSHQAVLDAARAIVAPIERRTPKAMVADRGAGGPPPALVMASDPRAQAEVIVDRVRDLIGDGVPLEEIAVLVRSMALESRPLVLALEAAGIAFQVRGGTGLFERREVRDAMGWMRAAVDPADPQAHLRLAALLGAELPWEKVTRLVSEADGESLTEGFVALARATVGSDLADRLLAVSRAAITEGPRDFARIAIEESGLRPAALAMGGAKGTGRLEGLNGLERLAAELVAATPEIDNAGLVAHLRQLAAVGYRGPSSGPPQRRGVQLMTIHQAKGLEFDAVVVAGMVERNFPGRSRDADDIPDALLREALPRGPRAALDESRRLAYVALTRARDHLFVIGHHENDVGWRQNPSPFMREIARELDVDIVDREPRQYAFALDEIAERRRVFDELAVEAARRAGSEGAEVVRAEALAAAEALIDSRAEGLAPRPPPTPPPTPPPALTLTPSDVADHMQCPLRYRYSRVDGIPPADDTAARVGNAVHAAFEAHYNPETGDGDGAVLLGRIREELTAREVAETPQGVQALQRAEHLVERYHENHLQRGVRVEAVERSFTLPIDPHTLRVRVDRIDRLPDGATELVDYKTGAWRDGWKPDHQTLPIKLYVAAVRAATGASDLQASFHHVLDRDTWHPLALGDDEIEDALTVARTTADDIVAGEFTPTPGWHCRTCAYNDICPEAER